MRRVILESPFAGKSKWRLVAWRQRRRHVAYARACVRDSLLRGEAPLASHLLYTQPGILRDDVPAERAKGIAAGLCWRFFADAAVVYVDYGISRGMAEGIRAAKHAGLDVELRKLGGAMTFLEKLLLEAALAAAQAAFRDMTPAELEAQRRSFAYGNCAIGNPNVTRALVAEVAEKFPGSVIAFGDDIGPDERAALARTAGL
jgi:hypothetical protein